MKLLRGRDAARRSIASAKIVPKMWRFRCSAPGGHSNRKLDSPGGPERQHSGVSRNRRDVPALEIAAARRAAAVDGAVPIRRFRQALRDPANIGFIKIAAGLDRSWWCRARIRATSSCARFSSSLLFRAPRGLSSERSEASLVGAQYAERLFRHRQALRMTACTAPPSPWTNCSTITPRNSRSAAAGPAPMPARLPACRIPPASPTCAPTPPSTPPRWRVSRPAAFISGSGCQPAGQQRSQGPDNRR